MATTRTPVTSRTVCRCWWCRKRFRFYRGYDAHHCSRNCFELHYGTDRP